MAGDGHDLVVREAELLGDGPGQLDAVGQVRIDVPRVRQRALDLDVGLGLDLRETCVEQRIGFGEDRLVVAAQVEQQPHFAGDDNRRVRVHVELPDGRVQLSWEAVGELAREDDKQRGAVERVLAVLHDGRARVGLLAAHHDPVFAGRPGRGDEADGRAGVLEQASLLDVDLGAQRGGGPVALSKEPGGAERLFDADAGLVAHGKRILESEHARVHGRAHHGGHEPRPLFVEPVDDGDVVLRAVDAACCRLVGDAERGVGRGEHPVGAVVLARGWLRIHVRSDEHVWRARHQLEQPELVADPVVLDREAAVFEQALEPATLLVVGLACSLPVDAAVSRRPETAHGVEVAEERVVAGRGRGGGCCGVGLRRRAVVLFCLLRRAVILLDH